MRELTSLKNTLGFENIRLNEDLEYYKDALKDSETNYNSERRMLRLLEERQQQGSDALPSASESSGVKRDLPSTSESSAAKRPSKD